MRNFIASMAMVSGVVVIVTTFNNGVSNNVIGGNSLRSSINEQAINVNTSQNPDPVASINVKYPVYNTVFDISTAQLIKKFSSDEVITFRDVKGKTTNISTSGISELAAGVYIIRKDSKIYRYLKK